MTSRYGLLTLLLRCGKCQYSLSEKAVKYSIFDPELFKFQHSYVKPPANYLTIVSHLGASGERTPLVLERVTNRKNPPTSGNAVLCGY